ncbi:THAP domain-containing protein 1 [Oryzias melastigma]|uniref:THAP domain-containing protein 1-like n=1 Tax=Oryzias melastigma TaxID=30732 RepID=A0A3B3DPQ2_ORYME|nr:THAP domain-containing protein 1 [Oryzias melastigma]
MACSAKNCVNRHCKDSSLHFFRFPLRDPERLKMWLLNINRKDWIPSTSSRLCSQHFEKDQIILNRYGLSRLKSNAVPTIFNIPNAKKMEASACPYIAVLIKEEEIIDESSLASTSLAHTEHNYVNKPIEVIVKEEPSDSDEQNEEVLANDNTTANVGCLDHNYIVADSPLLLKRKMGVLQVKLQAARKKIKLRDQRIRRLQKKVSSLKNAISFLEKNFLILNKFNGLPPNVVLVDYNDPDTDDRLSLGE